MHVKTTLAVWAFSSVMLLAALGARASPINSGKNKCLPENGGQLIAGDERIRDGDWDTVAQHHAGQSGSIFATIVWDDPCYIEYIGYKLKGYSYSDSEDNDCGGTAFLSLCLNGLWSDVRPWVWRKGSIWPENPHDDNSRAGWESVTGIALRAGLYGYDTASAAVDFYEIQAWTPEPGTLMLLLVGAPVTLMRCRRHR